VFHFLISASSVPFSALLSVLFLFGIWRGRAKRALRGAHLFWECVFGGGGD